MRQIIHIFQECEARVNKYEFICIKRWNLTLIHQDKGNFLFITFFFCKTKFIKKINLIFKILIKIELKIFKYFYLTFSIFFFHFLK